MTAIEKRRRIVNRVLMVAGWLILLWPIPGLLALREAGEPYFGYPLRTAVVISGYLVFLILAAVVMLLRILDRPPAHWLENQILSSVPAWAFAIVPFVLAVGVLLSLLLVRYEAIPLMLRPFMSNGPQLLIVILGILVSIRVTPPLRLRGAPALLLSGIGVIFIALLIVNGYFTNPVDRDSTVHMYLGVEVYNGGVPYADVFYLHPVMRFVTSSIWTLLSDLTGASVPIVGRTLALLSIAVIFLLTFLIAINSTGSVDGGFLALVVMIILHEVFFAVILTRLPNIKLTVVVWVLLAVWLIQHERFFLSGLAAGVAGLLWVPASTIGVVLVLCAALTPHEQQARNTGLVIAGGLLVVGAAAVALLSVGALAPAVQQVYGAALQFAVGDSASNGGGLLDYGSALFSVLNNNFWLALVSLASLPIVSYRSVRQRYLLKDAPTFVVLGLLLVLSVDFQTSVDPIVLVPLIGVASATTLIEMIDSLQRHLELKRIDSYVMLCLVTAFLITVPFSFNLAYFGFLASNQSDAYSYADQVEQAESLREVLETGDTVQSFNGLWVNVILGMDNATPVMQFGSKGNANLDAAGVTSESLAQQIADARPAVILIFDLSRIEPYPDFAALLAEDYTHAATVWINQRDVQEVYVLNGRDDIIEVVQGWVQADPTEQ
ncbi:MAG: MFS transporter [Chloroflexi bacterium]|nr:MFS transporter [Chloroflexota bacterium]